MISTLSKEEKRFVKENFKFAKEIIKVYEKIMIRISSLFLCAEFNSDTSSDIDKKFRVIIHLYLMPLILECYQSILEALRKGRKIPASILFRAQIESFIDFCFLLNKQDLAERYLDYHSVAAKWYLDSLENVEDTTHINKSEVIAKYDDFIKKYNIIPKSNELSTWSGLSIRRMASQIEDGDNIYSFYCRYSAYNHHSSNAMIILASYETEIDVKEDVLHEIFMDSFFMGGLLLFSTIGNLIKISKIEGDSNYDRLRGKLRQLFERFNELMKKTTELKEISVSFHGETEIGF